MLLHTDYLFTHLLYSNRQLIPVPRQYIHYIGSYSTFSFHINCDAVHVPLMYLSQFINSYPAIQFRPGQLASQLPSFSHLHKLQHYPTKFTNEVEYSHSHTSYRYIPFHYPSSIHFLHHFFNKSLSSLLLSIPSPFGYTSVVCHTIFYYSAKNESKKRQKYAPYIGSPSFR